MDGWIRTKVLNGRINPQALLLLPLWDVLVITLKLSSLTPIRQLTGFTVLEPRHRLLGSPAQGLCLSPATTEAHPLGCSLLKGDPGPAHSEAGLGWTKGQSIYREGWAQWASTHPWTIASFLSLLSSAPPNYPLFLHPPAPHRIHR